MTLEEWVIRWYGKILWEQAIAELRGILKEEAGK